MSEKQIQQHSQHFNLSGEAKQKLEKLTARRYPGKQRRQSQLIEDLITQAFAKEYNMSTDTAGTQEPESDGLAPLTQAAARMGQKMAQRLNATETTPEHLLLGLVLQSEEDVRDVFTALQVEMPAIRSHLALRFIAEHQGRAEQKQKSALSLKHAIVDPWTSAAQRYKPGQIVTGTVTKIAPFGAFVRVEDGIEGMIHFSELSLIVDYKTILHEGTHLQLRILHIDIERHHLSLSPAETTGNNETAFTEQDTDKSEQLKAEEFLTASEGSVAPAVDMPLERPPLSSEAQAAIKMARWMAKRMHSPLIQPEHLLLGLLQNQPIQVLLAPLLPMAPLPELLHSYIEGSTQAKEQRPGVCPHCQRPVQTQWKHCVYCGRALTKVCPECGTPRAEVEGLRFCYECGAQLD